MNFLETSRLENDTDHNFIKQIYFLPLRLWKRRLIYKLYRTNGYNNQWVLKYRRCPCTHFINYCYLCCWLYYIKVKSVNKLFIFVSSYSHCIIFSIKLKCNFFNFILELKKIFIECLRIYE